MKRVVFIIFATTYFVVKTDAIAVPSFLPSAALQSGTAALKHIKSGTVPLINIPFQGLIEKSDVDKNTFSCPPGSNSGIYVCENMAINAIGYDVSGGRTLQISNNQEYWLQKEAEYAHYVITVRNYTGTGLDAVLAKEGWKAMGGYSIVISSDPLLTNLIMPDIMPTAQQIKLIVQLWYSGDDMIQLWSQDAVVVSAGQGIQVIISSKQDDRLPKILPAKNQSNQSWRDQFLDKLNMQPSNRKTSTYQNANGSPRQVRFTVS